MTDVGLDYAFARPPLDVAWAAGYRFVSRYLSWDNPNTHGKILFAAELAALRAKGFEVALNWEYDAQDQLGGASAGTQHATEAVRQARALGYPTGCTIYFSADFDATEAQQATINAYMVAAAKVVHETGYRIGIYGGYWVVKRAFDAGVTDDGWQTYAWSNGQWDTRAAIRQDQNGIRVGGADCDHNTRVDRTYLMGGTVAAHGSRPEDEMATIVLNVEDNKYYSLGGDGRARRLKMAPGTTINDVGFVLSGKYRPGGARGAARPGVLCSNPVIDAEPHIDIPAIPLSVIALADEPVPGGPAVVDAKTIAAALADPAVAKVLADAAFAGAQRAEKE